MAWFFRHDSCRQRLAELEERIEKAERLVGHVDQDQRDLVDRFNRYEGRVKKRDAVDKVSQAERPLTIGGIRGIRR
jgi:hypothetical protein